MSRPLKIFLSIVWLLVTLSMLALAVFAIINMYWGLMVVCLMLAGAFGVFVYLDYKFFFVTPKTVSPTVENKNE